MENLKSLLLSGARAYDISLSKADIDKFMVYKDLIQEWNLRVNLTAITEDEEIIRKHFLDSLSLLDKSLPDIRASRVIDVGTGGGFPGIPLKIVSPQMKITLLDSLKKRCTFLELCSNALGIEGDTEVLHMRAEDGGKDPHYRESFDFCVSRAVAGLEVLSEYCLPFVRQGGYFLSMKGPAVFEEAQRAKPAIEALGGSLESIRELSLPFEDARRYIAVIKKIKPTPLKYPRKAGKALKSPIKQQKIAPKP